MSYIDGGWQSIYIVLAAQHFLPSLSSLASSRLASCDNLPIGLLLCATKSDTLVRLTLPEGNHQIYAAKYLDYMPTEEELKRELNLNDFEKLTEEKEGEA